MVLLLLFAAGCGRKQPPQPLSASTPPPRIAALHHEVSKNALRLRLRLAGAGGVLGYQIDRARIDPICRCRSEWRRDYEFAPRPGMEGEELVHVIPVRLPDVEFLYRVRAIDALGRLGPWSAPMHIRWVRER
ncbi:MAG: hypothetical protein D6682_05510 [Zetaproteobacteria bacterium]|nr:MAG: hypothetical protein D6682_05510 [Zetaproteobacteria bacterium]